MLEENKIHLGDCLDLMPSIPSKSIDMILCDLPYGTTACEWDSIIDMARLWQEYERVIKDNGAIVLTAREPFTSKLVVSNIKAYKHKWIWNKKQSGSFATAKFMPLQIEEDILVFSSKGKKVNYYPIMRQGKNRKRGGIKKKIETMHDGLKVGYEVYSSEYFPTNILNDFPNCSDRGNNIHPTQKPVALFEYLIKTYTNENEIVLDNCSGSGTTAVACMNTNRRFICIEKDETYHRKSLERLANHEPLLHMGDKC